MKFTWIPFYKEFANKLLKYRNDRQTLLKPVYENEDYFKAGYLHDKNGKQDKCKDIDGYVRIYKIGIRLPVI